MTPEERVRRGMALLDAYRPGWEREIDLDRLSIRSCKSCVLGQLFGDFDDGLDALGLDSNLAEIYEAGFDRSSEKEVTYARLSAEWADAIEIRRAAVLA